MKALHPLSRCALIACDRHETAPEVLRLAIYASRYGSLGRVVMEPILFNTILFGKRGFKFHDVVEEPTKEAIA